MGHGGGPGLAVLERLFDLQDFGALQASNVGGELLQRAGDQSHGGHKLSMTVPLDDLAGDPVYIKSQPGTDDLLNLEWHGGVGSDCAGDLADGDSPPRFREPDLVPSHLLVPEGEFKSKCGGLRVNAMSSANHDGILVHQGLLTDGRCQLLETFLQNNCCFHQLQGQSGIDNIGRCQAEVDESGLLAKGFGNSFEEGGHIVMGDFQYLIHAIEIKPSLLDLRDISPGDDAKLCPGLAHRDLDLQPFIKLVFVRPDPFHLWTGVSFDHDSSLKLAHLPQRSPQRAATLPSILASITSHWFGHPWHPSAVHRISLSEI